MGVTFLEETFSAQAAPPEHRLHQKAARLALKALLPESGTDIKGQMRSRSDLLEASGYANRPSDFDDLIRILDPELRLITPTEPEGVAGGEWRVTGEGAEVVGGERPVAGGNTDEGAALPTVGGVAVGDDRSLKPDAQWPTQSTGETPRSMSPSHPTTTHHPPPATRYYQLTHDYLVHSLRDWLTRKQRETRRGRAELRLAERAALWEAKPENRHLPSALEWVNIRALTRPKEWTEPQRRMMRRTGRFHGLRAFVLAGLVAAVDLGGDRGLRHPAGGGAGGIAPGGRYDRRFTDHRAAYRLPAVGRPSAPADDPRFGRVEPRSPSRQPCHATGRSRAG